MRQILAIILVATLMFSVISGIPVSLGDENGSENIIGVYERWLGSGNLLENHVTRSGEDLKIKGPSFTNTLRVDKTFLEDELGPGWSASKVFTPDGGQIVITGREVTFSPLEFGPDPVFTLGGRDQLEFQNRPMWVSVEQDEPGGQITLHMEDGDTTGQPIFIAKEWLWNRGIHRPMAVHEDGTNLSVERALGGDGWMIEMHHFSYVVINPPELEVMGRQGGIVFPHAGDRFWHEEKKVLGIDVAEKEDDYQVLIDKDWVDMNVPYPDVLHHAWTVEINRLTTDYYVVALAPYDTPTTLNVQPHLRMIDIEDPFDSDPYQELKAINETSLKLALATGNLTFTILGEELFINSKYKPNEVYWQSTTNESGSFIEEIYLITNNDPDDQMIGEIRFVDEYFSLSMVFNTTDKLGSYIGISGDFSYSSGGVHYREIHFFDPINFTLDIPTALEGNVTAGEADSQTQVIGQPMRYVAYIDQSAYQQILEESGSNSPDSAFVCMRASVWYPVSTVPFSNVGVPMTRGACVTDPNGVRLSSGNENSATSTLRDYTEQYQNFPLGSGDVIMFVTGFEFTGPRGAAWQGPGHIWSSDDQERRYSVTTINENKYPNDVNHRWASTIIFNHELGHNLRANHHHAATDVPCDRVGPNNEPARGITIMADSFNNNEALTGQYCFMFSDERHSPIGLPGEETQSAMAIQYGSIIYETRPDDWW